MSGVNAAAEALRQHPDADRFLAAVRNGGWEVGDVLPSHGPGCYGCGADNPSGFRLVARADEGQAVVAELTFDDRHLGAPGLVHGGAIAGVIDDLYGMALVREPVARRHGRPRRPVPPAGAPRRTLRPDAPSSWTATVATCR